MPLASETSALARGARGQPPHVPEGGCARAVGAGRYAARPDGDRGDRPRRRSASSLMFMPHGTAPEHYDPK